MGKRNAWYTQDSKLLRDDASVVCEVKLPRLFDSRSTVTVGKHTYEFRGRHGPYLWEMRDGNKIICRARRPKAWRSLIILEELDDAGKVKYKTKMRSKIGLKRYLYKLPLQSSDVQAFEGPDGDPVIQLSPKVFTCEPGIYVTVNDAGVSDVFLGYVFIIYRMMLRDE